MKNVILSLAVTVTLFVGTNLAHAHDPHCPNPHRGPSPYGSRHGSPHRAGYAPGFSYGGITLGNFGAHSNFGPYGSGLTLHFGARPTVTRYYFSPTLNRSCGCSSHGPCRHHAGHAPHGHAPHGHASHGHDRRSW